MAQFTVRIELHGAQWEDYEALHSAMQRKGFSRQITADSGRTYLMPWAEYDATASLSSMEVLGAAQQAANSTGKKNAVLVTEVKSRAWSGLTFARS
ncbi:MAG: hypothetical protein ABR910_01335 [Acidobacteriaceae bacterium]|jgi:hypothetical protein